MPYTLKLENGQDLELEVNFTKVHQDYVDLKTTPSHYTVTEILCGESSVFGLIESDVFCEEIHKEIDKYMLN